MDFLRDTRNPDLLQAYVQVCTAFRGLFSALFAQRVSDLLDELEESESITEQADALVDAIYYICDTAARHGMNLDPLFDIVHQANMSKIVDGHVIRRDDGKIMKPDTWIDPAPLLIEEVERQHRDGSFS